MADEACSFKVCIVSEGLKGSLNACADYTGKVKVEGYWVNVIRFVIILCIEPVTKEILYAQITFEFHSKIALGDQSEPFF